VTTAGYATALYWPWLNQIYEAYRVRCGKAASVGGLVFLASNNPCRSPIVCEQNACFGNGNWNPVRPRAIVASMAGYVVIRITERLGGGEPLRTAYAVAEPNQHRAIALFKLRPDHTADEQVEAVVELSQSALDSLGLKPGMIKPL
jgi:hypothetical protein